MWMYGGNNILRSLAFLVQDTGILFLPRSQIVATPLTSLLQKHASCASLDCCSFELIASLSVGNIAKKTVSGIRHFFSMAIANSIPETYDVFGILSLAPKPVVRRLCNVCKHPSPPFPHKYIPIVLSHLPFVCICMSNIFQRDHKPYKLV